MLMRTVTLVLALAAACAASPALAQARILIVQDQTLQPAAPAQTGPTASPPAAAPAPAAKPAAPPAETQAPAPAPEAAKPPAAEPAEDQSASQSQSQNQSEAKRQDRALPRAVLRLGRFRFVRVDNGFLRLDRRSGRVAYCTSHDNGWSCVAVPEQRASLERQVAQLRDEVAGLEMEVARLRAALPPPPPPSSPPPPHPVPPQTVPPTPHAGDQTGGIALKLPSHEDIARARGFIADTWHRLVDMIESMQKDLLRKDGDEANGVSRT
jgi:hypothetical protein